MFDARILAAYLDLLLQKPDDADLNRQTHYSVIGLVASYHDKGTIRFMLTSWQWDLLERRNWFGVFEGNVGLWYDPNFCAVGPEDMAKSKGLSLCA